MGVVRGCFVFFRGIFFRFMVLLGVRCFGLKWTYSFSVRLVVNMMVVVDR